MWWNAAITAHQRSGGKVMFSVIPMMHWNSPYKDLPPKAKPPTPRGILPPPTSDIWRPRLETCLDLFTWGFPLLVIFGGQNWRLVQTCSLQDPHPRCWHLLANVARTVCKRTVHIRLECFLVFILVAAYLTVLAHALVKTVIPFQSFPEGATNILVVKLI